ncbi:hypothetical protein DMB66_07250 [Actinoplanes sp. ATCC 53533]|nr:hypothetical protein DMB66_07250 [Actinoplanes sp. ATCC 53533]
MFSSDAVEIHEMTAGRQRAARISGGSLVVAFGLAAVAVNAEDRGNHGLGVALWVMTGVLVLVGAIGAGAWWMGSALRQSRRDAVVIAAPSVTAAESVVRDGRVTVTVRTDDGPARTFSAVGHAGATLATEFARLLQAPTPAAEEPSKGDPRD